jgi:hypothetical protein
MEQAAAGWIGAHPRKDVYLFGEGQKSNYFPLSEVYAIDLAQVGSSGGAKTN